MLISEMHFTEQSYLKLLNYHIIWTIQSELLEVELQQ
jgi:hypothetical protein